MDPRRVTRTVIDPKVRQVGFFAPPDRFQSFPPAPDSSSTSMSDVSLSGNSLSPVMIPPPRHLSSDLCRNFHQPPPASPLRVAGRAADSYAPVGSYNPSGFLSPTSTADFSEELLSPRFNRKDSFGKFATSLPAGGFDMEMAKQRMLNLPPGNCEAERGSKGQTQKEQSSVSGKPLKEKPTKSERRAIQEAQRAAKDAAKGEISKTSAIPQIKASVSTFENRQADKDRKKDVPHPRMQFDDQNRVDKAKKRSVVKQTESRNRVELFRHLPQYEHGTRLPDLESKFFQLDPVHPAVFKVGLKYLSGDLSGGNARCIAMLQALQDAINDYTTPREKSLVRDLTTKISSYVSFLIECRPLSISMGNAIRFLKNQIAHLPLNLSESDAKSDLISGIDLFMNEKIILADKLIVKHAVTKIRDDDDVLLTYGSSSAVELILLHAHELGKRFRVVIVDSRPKLEGRTLLRRLVGKGIKCTYTHINAVSYIMREVTRVFLGASSVCSNGTIYSRVGTACVAMVARQFRIPVLVCCEAYKFHERVQLDSICANELGDPDVISKVSGRREIDSLDGWANTETLQLLNLVYDATPSDYVSMIITDYGMIPPTSVPVIIREYRREHLWL